MRIALDCDGVIYSYDSAARYMLREYRGCKGLDEPSTHWDFIQETVSPSDWDWLWSEGVKRGLFRYGHGIRGAIIGIRKLAEAGHELLIVTHRPRSAVRDTIDWLSYMHLPVSEVHILSDEEPKTFVKADILIDDKWENVKAWSDVGRFAILFSQPWNRQGHAHNGVSTVDGWREVVECVSAYERAERANQDLLQDASGPNAGWRA